MSLRRWSSDTIGRWLAINIVTAVVVAAGMNAAFVQFAGVWAKPSIRDIGLVDQAAAIVRVMEGAPPAARAALATAAGNSTLAVHWYPNAKAMPLPTQGATFHAAEAKVRALLARPNARALAYEPGDPGLDATRIANYALAIDMSDGSWVEFVTPRRSWGLNPRARYLLTGAFVLACSFVVAALASRRLARPMERFAKHAQRFGMDVNAAPLQFSGPVEFRIAAHAFNEMQSRIQRYVVGRTELLAAISHDLRAPLTRMRLRGEFIEDEDQQRKLFRDVDEMQAMVDASLAFFRDDSEQEQTTRFKLTELVNTIVDDFRDQSYGVAFEDSPAITYVGRPMGLRRAICNLVENALKYGVCARVSIQVTVDGIEIAVEDEGPGIALHLREAVFRPFYRIESSRNRTTGGVGLGLAAARSAVRAHGGDIVLNEGTAGGLRARLLLPLA